MDKENNNFKINFIGIGVQRSGSTWIADCLAEHPQICLSHPKEVHFFGTPKYKFGFGWYKKHFSSQADQITGEFSVGYYASKAAAQQIKKHFPDIKIVVCLRNPIDRAFSNYLSIASFEAKNKSFENWLLEHPEMIDRGKYFTHLKIYFDLFPKENILVVIYEDINKNPLKFIQRIYKFLKVDESFIPKTVQNRKNQSKTYRYPIVKITTGKVIKYVYSLKYGINIANFLRLIGFKRILNLIERANTRPIGQPPQISASTKKNLQEIYHWEIKNLEKLINQDLSSWN